MTSTAQKYVVETGIEVPQARASLKHSVMASRFPYADWVVGGSIAFEAESVRAVNLVASDVRQGSKVYTRRNGLPEMKFTARYTRREDGKIDLRVWRVA